MIKEHCSLKKHNPFVLVFVLVAVAVLVVPSTSFNMLLILLYTKNSRNS